MTFLALFLLAAAAQAKPARYAETWLEGRSIYWTKYVNATPRRLKPQEAAIQAPEELQAYYGEYNFSFYCPGDSFMIGMHARYDLNHRANTAENYSTLKFRFGCAFLEDLDGILILKADCPPPKELQADHEDLGPGESKCSSEQFIHGMLSQRPLLGKKLENYRQSQILCCHAGGQDGSTYYPDTQQCSSFQRKSTEVDFVCPKNQVLTKVWSQYQSATMARSYTFQCCALTSD